MIFAKYKKKLSYDNDDNDSLKHVLFNKNFEIFIKKKNITLQIYDIIIPIIF